jgi:hypothetical protein
MAHEKDRLKYGFDAGTIIDGTIRYDNSANSYFIEDVDGDKFYPNAALAALNGEKVRFTLISFKSMQHMEDLYNQAMAAFDQIKN